jgi:hypothetical protein
MAGALQIPEMTIHTILKSAQEIETKALNLLKHSEVKVTRQRSDVMEIMKRRLATWIEDLYQQHTPISLAPIQEKGISLYEAVKELGEEEATEVKPFDASGGSFHCFQKKYGFKNVKIQGEAASTHVKAADAFPAELKRIIKEGVYYSKQVFNTDETGLYWKRMPSQTYISNKVKSAPGFKPSKDQVTLVCQWKCQQRQKAQAFSRL